MSFVSTPTVITENEGVKKNKTKNRQAKDANIEKSVVQPNKFEEKTVV